MSDPRCEICSDAWGTHFVCDECRRDPANTDWRPSRGAEIVVEQMEMSASRVAIVTALARARFGLSQETQAQIASRLGVSQARVSEIHAELLADKFYHFASVREREARREPEDIDLDRLSMESVRSRERAFVSAAWLEWRCNQDTQRDDFEPPRWFVRLELGYAPGEAPCLTQTCDGLAKQNALALCILDEPHLRVTFPRNFYPDPVEERASIEDASDAGRGKSLRRPS